MRTRATIVNDLKNRPTLTYFIVILLEVLLDIRDLLTPPVVIIDKVDQGEIDEMIREYTEKWNKNIVNSTTATTSPTGKYCEDCGSYDHNTSEH